MNHSTIETIAALANRCIARADGYRMAGDSERAFQWRVAANHAANAARAMSRALEMEREIEA